MRVGEGVGRRVGVLLARRVFIDQALDAFVLLRPEIDLRFGFSAVLNVNAVVDLIKLLAFFDRGTFDKFAIQNNPANLRAHFRDVVLPSPT